MYFILLPFVACIVITVTDAAVKPVIRNVNRAAKVHRKTLQASIDATGAVKGKSVVRQVNRSARPVVYRADSIASSGDFKVKTFRTAAAPYR